MPHERRAQLPRYQRNPPRGGGSTPHADQSWLENYKIYFDKLIMRGDRDFRKSPDYKSSVCDSIEAEGNKIFLAVEDRKDCLDMFISRGIFTFDVANGSLHDV